MAGTGGPLRLRDWLVAQIESGQYEGLLWEDAGKTLFRIPWKHAAKQGYQAQQDAALFRAWAVYKGKHSEGTDKDDPSTWKTRLRCALNKSMDFCEVRERSQLDTSNPYKVYRIVSHGGRSPVARLQVCPEEEGIPQEPLRELSEPACKINQECSRLATKDKSQFCMVAQQASLPPASLLPDPLADHRYPAQNPRKLWSPMLSEDFSSPGGSREDPCHDAETAKKGPGANTAELSRVPVPADCRLHVRLFYSAALVLETTVRSAQVCSLSPRADATATAAEHLLGAPASLAPICFPEPPPRARLLRRLLRHLERGVLLWAAPEGVFARRRCRGRVYWLGPLAPHRARPNKLERERTCQLLDTRCFFRELRAHFQDGGPKPEYQIRLCFGEEYPGPSDQPEERLIMAHVEPVFARQLLLNWKHSDVQQGP